MAVPSSVGERGSSSPAARTGEHGGLWPSPWPSEDGGARRSQSPRGSPGLFIGPGERLACVARRDAFATTMVVLREPGEVFALRHTIGSRPLRDPCVAWVERIDPVTLEVRARSNDLPAGPFWPGGLAAHANGSLYVVFGRHCHRLSAQLDVLSSVELPQPRAYNSFVVMGDGTLVMKDIDRTLTQPARLTLLDPDTLTRRFDDVTLSESAVARLSGDGDRVYAVGTGTVYGFTWDGSRLDPTLEVPYRPLGARSYGWDPVIAGGQLWFLDHGEHRYATTMSAAGVADGPVQLVRVSLSDPSDAEAVAVGDGRRGAVTNPPLYDPERRIAVGYDSASGIVAAFRFDQRLEPLWEKRLAHAAHMIHYRDSGELVLHDWSGPRLGNTRLVQAVASRAGRLATFGRVRAAMARRSRDDVVVLDIETGEERARAGVPTMFQSVLFPAPGWGRDLYWCTFSTLARLEVQPA